MNFSKPTKTVDVLGQTCPYPVLKTGAALRKLRVEHNLAKKPIGEITEYRLDTKANWAGGFRNRTRARLKPSTRVSLGRVEKSWRGLIQMTFTIELM